MTLCGLIASVLGGKLIAPPGVVDDDLAALARKRHRVGPLLHHAVVTNGGSISQTALEMLTRDRRDNERRQAICTVLLQGVAHWFATAGIRWTLMKGLGLARQLYSDPSLRPSADIDLLVAPADFSRAIRVLESNGFRNITGCPATPMLRAAALYLFRDVTLLGPIGPRIELHQRPLFIDRRHVPIAPLACGDGCAPIPVPAIDSNLAHYLIGHGALCYWSRLKWLVDLVPLLAALDDAVKAELVAKSRRAHTASSVCASLLLLRMLFPCAALGALEPWIECERHGSKVKRRLAHYVRAIDRPDLLGQTPLDNRIGALRANLMFSEAIVPRLRAITFGPAASLLRAMARVK